MSIKRKIFRYVSSFLRNFNPTQVVALGFLLIILIGATILCFPISNRSGDWEPFINNLFTATSATCVTGLVVHDTFTQYTVFGQIIVLMLIQVGGIGFMTLATMLSMVFRRAISLKERLLIKESVNTNNIEGVVRLTKLILKGTFIFEGAGAFLLSIKFIPQFGFLEGIYNGVFHAVSAFCNAGFDLMGKRGPFTNLITYSDDFTVNIVIMCLIVIGGLGFIVWEDLYTHHRASRWSLHTKMVLSITGLLILSGAIFFACMEWTNPATIGNMPVRYKILASFFQSVTTRTAGYMTVDQAALTVPSKFFSIILMFIGGSPGSTAGGIKTVTFGIMLLSVVSALKGDDYINAFRKKLTSGTMLRAIALVLMSGSLVITGTILMIITEGPPFLDTVFEVVSAFATVGLSTGVTLTISAAGKLILITIMYLGRVGITTVLLSLLMRRTSNQKRYSYAEDRVMLG